MVLLGEGPEKLDQNPRCSRVPVNLQSAALPCPCPPTETGSVLGQGSSIVTASGQWAFMAIRYCDKRHETFNNYLRDVEEITGLKEEEEETVK
ncbi:hypothetical protein TREES_T100017494 [Tupaia chinensis]|uniref:Uncharacterized protein n=1 Tax=Tupaia chinensis TaxID=246437 RepID=L9LFX0_TUPCH|nr:hypothetical protein TREES_T100017494 [Tupaia chinensis]